MAIRYALDRLKEPSTWAAIAAAIAGSIHIYFNQDFTNSFVAFGLAFSTLLGIALKEGVNK